MDVRRLTDVLPPVKLDVCYACAKDIEERELPSEIKYNAAITEVAAKQIGKYTVRRIWYDKDWVQHTEDTHFHEECYHNGFISAIRYGKILKDWESEGNSVEETLESARSDNGVDHD